MPKLDGQCFSMVLIRNFFSSCPFEKIKLEIEYGWHDCTFLVLYCPTSLSLYNHTMILHTCLLNVKFIRFVSVMLPVLFRNTFMGFL